MSNTAKTPRFDPNHPTYDLPFCVHEAGGECHCKRCRQWAEAHPATAERDADNDNVLWF